MQKIELNRVYRHYKGNMYRIIAFAKHSETLEDMIIYQSLDDGKTWARPYYMWNEIVDKNNTLRFTLVED